MSLFSTGNSLLCSQLTSNFANMCQLGNFFALLRKGAALCSLRSTKMNKVSIVSYSVICLGGGWSNPCSGHSNIFESEGAKLS